MNENTKNRHAIVYLEYEKYLKELGNLAPYVKKSKIYEELSERVFLSPITIKLIIREHGCKIRKRKKK